ncbi:MAG: hypothetical protein OEY14_08770, partial [Myxococcales bacterium]|nr:hypothetical protein [Myxococcales bacterium]
QASEASEALRAQVDYAAGFEPNAAYRIDPSDPFAIELELPFDPAVAGFIRLELERDLGALGGELETLTNPIYHGAWGLECATSVPLP